jgi:hypothetical protein
LNKKFGGFGLFLFRQIFSLPNERDRAASSEGHGIVLHGMISEILKEKKNSFDFLFFHSS